MNMKNPILIAIKVYRIVNTWLRAVQVPGLVYTPCKFHPTCSEYAELAVQKYGSVRGSWKALTRILRCNPFTPGGVDYI